MYKRPTYRQIDQRIREPRRFIQVVIGPRQVGKTTSIHQVISAIEFPVVFASCDNPESHDQAWISQQWDLARLRADRAGGALLVIDEIQKIPSWSDAVKDHWDRDSALGAKIKVVLLGSSALLLHKGLSESLAGRFEIIRMPHWSLQEMSEAFGWDLDTFVRFGGYPGAAPLISDPVRWRHYVSESLIDPAISKDVLQMERIDKPALLRQLFHLCCEYSGQILSYQKMTGQLQDAGNTTTLAHYLELLRNAGLVVGLQKFSGNTLIVRNSSPKLQVFNTALMSAHYDQSGRELRENPALWGRLVESAAGAHLANCCSDGSAELFYWRERIHEVDFVVRKQDKILALEIKSGRRRENLPGLDQFCRKFAVHRRLLVGDQGMPLSEFLSTPVEQLF